MGVNSRLSRDNFLMEWSELQHSNIGLQCEMRQEQSAGFSVPYSMLYCILSGVCTSAVFCNNFLMQQIGG